MRPRQLALAVVLLMATLGCGSDDEGSAAPTEPPASETATAEVTALPTGDAEASQNPDEFASEYVTEVHRAYRLKDPDRLRAMSAPACETCRRYMATVEALIADDATVADGYTVDVLEVIAPTIGPDELTASVSVVLRIGEFVVLGSDGREVHREPSRESLVQSVDLERSDGRWRVAAVSNQ